MAFHFALAALLLAAFVVRPADKPLQIGDKAPLTDVEMLDVSGERFTLESTAGEMIDPNETKSIGCGIKFPR